MRVNASMWERKRRAAAAKRRARSVSREVGARVMVAAGVLGAAVLIWYTADIWLIVFAGILLAVFLDFLAGHLMRLLPVRRGWAFAIVVIAISVLFFFAAWNAVPKVANQVNDLVHALPQSLERLQAYLSSRPWGRTLLDHLPGMLASAGITGKLSSILTRVSHGLIGFVVILVLGLYLGATPGSYWQGFLKLVPAGDRERANDSLREAGYALRWWIVGQLVPMTVLGLASIIGLSLMHVTLAFTLGLFTGLMIFIPYIGSLIAWLVTVIVVLGQQPSAVVYVTLFFVAVHIAEGYLLTPLVQRRAVYLPPGLTIVSQVFMGTILGFFGLAMATPLTAAALVLVKMLYLRERPRHHEDT